MVLSLTLHCAGVSQGVQCHFPTVVTYCSCLAVTLSLCLFSLENPKCCHTNDLNIVGASSMLILDLTSNSAMLAAVNELHKADLWFGLISSPELRAPSSAQTVLKKRRECTSVLV